jgi:hypothetical protein
MPKEKEDKERGCKQILDPAQADAIYHYIYVVIFFNILIIISSFFTPLALTLSYRYAQI